MPNKLCQVLAIEKGVKQRTTASLTELHRVSQNVQLFNGFAKTYTPKDEEKGLQQPPQNQKVAFKSSEVVSQVRKVLVDLFDVVATKEWGNQTARADVVVDGSPLLTGVPATYLLFLDKQLADLKTFVEKFTELSATDDWREDPNAQLFRTDPAQTFSTQKVQVPVELAAATDKHPAQVQLITQDVVVGTWTTTKLSGALPVKTKKLYLERIQALIDAVRVALEEANTTEVQRQYTGAKIMGYVFGD